MFMSWSSSVQKPSSTARVRGSHAETRRRRRQAKPGADHGDRAGQFEHVGDAIAAEHQRERDQEQQALVGDPPHQQRRQPAAGEAERGAAADLAQHSASATWPWPSSMVSPWVTPSASRNSTTPAPSLNRLSPTMAARSPGGSADLLQQGFDHDRIGRRQDGAEHEAPDQRHRHADQAEGDPHAGAENRHGDHDARGGEHQDHAAPPVQFRNVDMQAAGEQQQRQHAVEEHLRQLRRIERAAEPPHHVQVEHVIAGDDEQRHHQRAEQHADRRRQLDPQAIDAADQHREREHDGEKVYRLECLGHGCGGFHRRGSNRVKEGTMPAPFAIRYSGATLPCKLAGWELPHVVDSCP